MSGGLSAPVEPTGGVLRLTRPLPGSTHVGDTPNGQPIYEITVTEPKRDERGRIIKEVVKGPGGEDVWVKHPTTGVPQYPRTRNVMVTRQKRYIIHVECNERGKATGQHTIVEWTDALQREAENAVGRKSAADFSSELFAKAAASGVTPEELLGKILDEEQEEPAPAIEAEFPRHLGFGNWELSDGSQVKGKREDAEAAEANLN